MTAKVTTTVELKSDLTGKPATETRVLTFDGATATVHLTDAEAANFDKMVGKYISKAHDVQVHPDTLREWARSQGMAVGDRGRISADIRTAYLTRNDEPVSESDEQTADEQASEPVSADAE